MTENKLDNAEDAILDALKYCIDALESLEQEDTDTAYDLISKAIRELEHALQQLRQVKS